MSRKLPIWEYLDDNEEIPKEITSHNSIRKNKITEKNKSNQQDSLWLKTLLQPSSEQNLLKFEIESVISHNEDKLICKLNSNNQIYSDFSTLIGCFDNWWWKNLLLRSEFIVIEEALKSYPFLNRILKNNNMIENSQKGFYLLLNAPIIEPDDNDPKIGLLTCKQFLIIE